jgi:hypothetical protein
MRNIIIMRVCLPQGSVCGYADEPKSLNYYLMDNDCVAMLKRMYGSDDVSTKQDLMEYGDLHTSFFGCEEKGKEVLKAVDGYTWDMLD